MQIAAPTRSLSDNPFWEYVDYIPGCSTVASIVHIFSKCIEESVINRWSKRCKSEKACHHDFKRLSRDSRGFYRDIVLLIPFIGNLIVYLFDYNAAKKVKNLLDNIPRPTESRLREEDLSRVEQACAYGSPQAFVLLAQHYEALLKSTNNPPKNVRAWALYIRDLYARAKKAGSKEASEWLASNLHFSLLIAAMNDEKKKDLCFFGARSAAEWPPYERGTLSSSLFPTLVRETILFCKRCTPQLYLKTLSTQAMMSGDYDEKWKPTSILSRLIQNLKKRADSNSFEFQLTEAGLLLDELKRSRTYEKTELDKIASAMKI